MNVVYMVIDRHPYEESTILATYSTVEAAQIHVGLLTPSERRDVVIDPETVYEIPPVRVTFWQVFTTRDPDGSLRPFTERKHEVVRADPFVESVHSQLIRKRDNTYHFTASALTQERAHELIFEANREADSSNE